MKTDKMTLEQARYWLKWAATPGNHGGTNPYGQPHIIEAARVVAAHDGTPLEGWVSSKQEAA